MRIAFHLIVLVAFAFTAGLMLGIRQEARANPPQWCIQWRCKEMHAWWHGGKSVDAAFFSNNGNPAAATEDAWTFIFTPSTTGDTPTGNGANIVVLEYDSCTPFCGLDANNVWQATQEVSEGGLLLSTSDPRQKDLCTFVGVANARQVWPPINTNPGRAAPPGWED